MASTPAARVLGTGRRVRIGIALPTRLLDARDQAAAGQIPEADPADAELAVEAAGTPAEATPIAMLHREFSRRLRLDLLGLGRHASFASSAGRRSGCPARRCEPVGLDSPTYCGSGRLGRPGSGRLAERHAEPSEQLAGLVVVWGRGDDG